MQRGRKSSAANVISLATTGASSRLKPPPSLSTAESSLFVELALANVHLTISDVPILAAYAQAATKVLKLGRQKDVGQWEKVVRLTMALARTLRLTPQSCIEPRTVGRRRKDATSPSYYEIMGGDGDDA